MSTVQILTSDGQTVTVDRKVVSKAGVIDSALASGAEGNSPLKLDNISASVLEKIIEYLKHHVDDQPDDGEDSDDDIDGPRRDPIIDTWDAKFIEVDLELLYELILAANYLDIKPLLDLGCKTVANMIKGKTPEEIRSHFNIPADFTPEEEEQIRLENEWAEDR